MNNKVRETFTESVYEVGKVDKKICVIVSDISHFRLQKFAKENPGRYYNLGVCENSILNTTEIYMLREICFSYSRVGREQVGYSLKRKFYQALFKEEYERDLKVNKLLKSVEAVKPEE